MIDAPKLLADAKKLVRSLENDLRARCRDHAPSKDAVRAAWQAARDGRRTGLSEEEWSEEFRAQVVVNWVLATVFIRFLEDNGLLDRTGGEPPHPRIGGVGEALGFARDQRSLYWRREPTHADLEWMQWVFAQASRLPGIGDVLDRAHNPLWALPLSADGAAELMAFWHRVDPETGAVAHDFTDPEWSTRFLGDLYQDLSELARKRYALLQTPEFVEEFILDRTLEPAIREFGYTDVRLIDPTCGSGHFLLGAFARLYRRWQADEPGTNAWVLAQRALDSVHGVDLNPFAVAIARFRLLLAALKVSGVKTLKGAPAFKIRVATGDSLLHSARGWQNRMDFDPLGALGAGEVAEEVREILGKRYHAVVGNPPYITVGDPVLNLAYREKYPSCSGKYSLSVPFMEAFFDLAQPGAEGRPAGFVGQITANSFMKREFGKKLIEQFIPKWDLTHVVDTSGAYIPGHGTPTVILFGRNRKPVQGEVRAVMGIRGEPASPQVPAEGLVWSAIVRQIDEVGSQSEFVSVVDLARERLHKHPWSMGGGGAAELKLLFEERAVKRLGELASEVGVVVVTGEDDFFVQNVRTWARLGISEQRQVSFVVGDMLRDWSIDRELRSLNPYGPEWSLLPDPKSDAVAWPFRTNLANYVYFGKVKSERGLNWRDFGFLAREKLRTPLSIAFAEVATHNHFVLDRGGKVFKQTAPVIKLPAGATEDDHLGLLGLLNSSTACFWMKQVLRLP